MSISSAKPSRGSVFDHGARLRRNMENEAESETVPDNVPELKVSRKTRPPPSPIPSANLPISPYKETDGFIFTKMSYGMYGKNHNIIENNWMDDLLVICSAVCCTVRFTDLSYYLFFGTHKYAAMSELDIVLAMTDDVLMAILAIGMFSSVVFPYKRWAVLFYVFGFLSLFLQFMASDGDDFLPKEQWKLDFLKMDIEDGYIVGATSIDVVGNSRTGMKYTVITSQVIFQLVTTIFIFGKRNLPL